MITSSLWEAMHTRQAHLETVKVEFFKLLVTHSFSFRILSNFHLYYTYRISSLTSYKEGKFSNQVLTSFGRNTSCSSSIQMSPSLLIELSHRQSHLKILVDYFFVQFVEYFYISLWKM